MNVINKPTLQFLFLILCSAQTTCIFAREELKPDRPPNIVILYADDLGYGDVAIQNAKSKIPTPNLDRLALSSLRFTDGHSSSGICTPSRYALLTGRYHWRDFYGIVNAFGKSKFKPELLTLPEMLKQKGYSTACNGKWHLGWDWDSIKKPNAKPEKMGKRNVWGPEDFDWAKPINDGPLAHGFDYYFGDTVINFPPYCWIENDRVTNAPDIMKDEKLWKPIKEGNWECRPGPMVSNWNPYDNIPTLTQKGVEYISTHAKSDEPYFLFFAFPSPHAPIIPNDKFDGKSKAGPYGDFVFETDDAIGQLLKAIDESGESENTVVIFSADNGPERYAYARDKNFDHWSAAPFRGLKRDIYEGGHHVPFFIRWPGRTMAGEACNALVSQIDIMATLANALNFQLPTEAATDSINLLPLLDGKVKQVRTTHVHNTFKNKFAIRHGQWNLVVGKDGYVSKRDSDWETRHDYPPDDETKFELYDITADPGQRYNLATKHPEIVNDLKSRLDSIRK